MRRTAAELMACSRLYDAAMAFGREVKAMMDTCSPELVAAIHGAPGWHALVIEDAMQIAEGCKIEMEGRDDG